MTQRLSEVKRGSLLRGVVPGEVVTVVNVRRYGGDTIALTFRREDGHLQDKVLYLNDQPQIDIVDTGRAWSFSADGRHFRLAAEAKRIGLAHLFDPYLVVTTALIDPLPHQITAVYERMLPQRPLRFLLADDPGAGKTVMTGLLVRELMMRGDLHRCLVVAPGSLVDQWKWELSEKFRLDFTILTRSQFDSPAAGNPFTEEDLLIARLDMLSRSAALQDKLVDSDWDLVVFDEAHKLSASIWAGEVRKTKRRVLAEKARDSSRHFLLLTATPHNGKAADFELFLSLLDPDRFEGQQRYPRQGAISKEEREADSSDLMRRVMKERLVRFDGSPLFPPRYASVVPFGLSAAESALYERVTSYVRDEMGRAERIKQQGDVRRGATIGFALTILQRRLASSPEAIYQSLRRRRERLEGLLHRELSGNRTATPSQAGTNLDEWFSRVEEIENDEATPEEAEATEDELLSIASTARTVEEFRREVETLRRLEDEAGSLRKLGTDEKWKKLAELLDVHLGRSGGGSQELPKLVVFTEYRDTLGYLVERIRTLLGRSDSVAMIHGGMPRELRTKQEAAFKNDDEVLVLVATDAAGEGINLQRAHLMVNYDLPWNPNRLEQRFGRIHRIGQLEPCHLWSLVAIGTREGDVYNALLSKIEEETRALGGEVFDILGSLVFGERSLRDLLVQAIVDGERPGAGPSLRREVDKALDREHLKTLLKTRALAAQDLGLDHVMSVRQEMERASAQRVYPHHVRAFFVESFGQLGGAVEEREPGRYELSHVPPGVLDNARQRGLGHVRKRYERVVFDKAIASVRGSPEADFLSPDHPLIEAIVDLPQMKHADSLRRGAVLVDRRDPTLRARVLVLMEHAIVDQRAAGDGQQRRVSQRLAHVELYADGSARDAGPVPYLDYSPPRVRERPHVERLLNEQRWLSAEGLKGRAQAFAIEHIARRHMEEVRDQVEDRVSRTEAAVKERLSQEIEHWSYRAAELERRELAGQKQKLNSARAWQRVDDLTARLERRLRMIEQERTVLSLPPVIVGAAVIVPQGYIDDLDGVIPDDDAIADRTWAVEQVLNTLRAAGCEAHDMSSERRGVDVLTHAINGSPVFVHAAIDRGQDRMSLTRSEAIAALNTSPDYVVALVGFSSRAIRWARPIVGLDLPFALSQVEVELILTPSPVLGLGASVEV